VIARVKAVLLDTEFAILHLYCGSAARAAFTKMINKNINPTQNPQSSHHCLSPFLDLVNPNPSHLRPLEEEHFVGEALTTPLTHQSSNWFGSWKSPFKDYIPRIPLGIHSHPKWWDTLVSSRVSSTVKYMKNEVVCQVENQSLMNKLRGAGRSVPSITWSCPFEL